MVESVRGDSGDDSLVSKIEVFPEPKVAVTAEKSHEAEHHNSDDHHPKEEEEQRQEEQDHDGLEPLLTYDTATSDEVRDEDEDKATDFGPLPQVDSLRKNAVLLLERADQLHQQQVAAKKQSERELVDTSNEKDDEEEESATEGSEHSEGQEQEELQTSLHSQDKKLEENLASSQDEDDDQEEVKMAKVSEQEQEKLPKDVSDEKSSQVLEKAEAQDDKRDNEDVREESQLDRDSNHPQEEDPRTIMVLPEPQDDNSHLQSSQSDEEDFTNDNYANAVLLALHAHREEKSTDQDEAVQNQDDMPVTEENVPKESTELEELAPMPVPAPTTTTSGCCFCLDGFSGDDNDNKSSTKAVYINREMIELLKQKREKSTIWYWMSNTMDVNAMYDRYLRTQHLKGHLLFVVQPRMQRMNYFFFECLENELVPRAQARLERKELNLTLFQDVVARAQEKITLKHQRRICRKELVKVVAFKKRERMLIRMNMELVEVQFWFYWADRRRFHKDMDAVICSLKSQSILINPVHVLRTERAWVRAQWAKLRIDSSIQTVVQEHQACRQRKEVCLAEFHQDIAPKCRIRHHMHLVCLPEFFHVLALRQATRKQKKICLAKMQKERQALLLQMQKQRRIVALQRLIQQEDAAKSAVMKKLGKAKTVLSRNEDRRKHEAAAVQKQQRLERIAKLRQMIQQEGGVPIDSYDDNTEISEQLSESTFGDMDEARVSCFAAGGAGAGCGGLIGEGIDWVWERIEMYKGNNDEEEEEEEEEETDVP